MEVNASTKHPRHLHEVKQEVKSGWLPQNMVRSPDLLSQEKEPNYKVCKNKPSQNHISCLKSQGRCPETEMKILFI